jgi:mono/diheme cytochrome c family protein
MFTISESRSNGLVLPVRVPGKRDPQKETLMNRRTLYGALSAGGVVAGICAFLILWRPAIEPVEDLSTFDSEQVARGAQVAEAGDCAVCHTRPGGKHLAGGLPLKTPFGTLYTTNITPDMETGIGQWSLEAFERAMRKGISRDGHFLYPAFPYLHYSRMSDGDIGDVYAYLMSGPAVHAPALANDMNFPMSIRPLVAFWNILFLHTEPLVPDESKSEKWNRGRYLVDGAGHCAGCHSPLNLIGGQKSGEYLAGGQVDGWEAPSLLGMADRRNPWTNAQLVAYLRAAVVPEHGTAAGPMRPVSLSIERLPTSDAESIAEYLLSLKQTRPAPELNNAHPPVTDVQHSLGESLFKSSCAGCHGEAAPMRVIDSRPGLVDTSALRSASSRNFLQTVLQGIPAIPGRPGPAMPPFSESLDDSQISALAVFLRSQSKPAQPWTDLRATIHELRQEAK